MNWNSTAVPFRRIGLLCALAGASSLAACGGAPDAPRTEAAKAASVAATQAMATVSPADPDAPGTLHFILSPSGAGNYWGWQVQVLAAEGREGFRPFLSQGMGEGQSLRAELLPGRYRVRVFLNAEVERDEWVEVVAGRPTVVFVDISFLTNDIDLVTGPEAAGLVAEAGEPDRDMRLAQTFEMAPVVLPGDELAQELSLPLVQAGFDGQQSLQSGPDGQQSSQSAPAAPPASHPPSAPAAASQVAQSAVAPAAIHGCTHVEGRFTADGGLSRLSFDGNGRGHMWQQTYGGSAVYTFDVDFSYSGTPDAMRFEYGPGIYKDAAGRIVDEKTIPGGDASCDYDGTTITINGKPFSR